MTPKQKRDQLIKVLTLAFERDQAELIAIEKQIALLNERFDVVGKAGWSASDVGENLALMGYAEQADAWIAQSRRQLSIELSAEYAKRGTAQDALRKSFGRLEAYRTLAKKQFDAERLQMVRRQVS